jgi:ribonuclease HI
MEEGRSPLGSRGALLRGTRVMAVTLPDGRVPQTKDGRVPIRYKAGGTVYLAKAANLAWDGGSAPILVTSNHDGEMLRAQIMKIEEVSGVPPPPDKAAAKAARAATSALRKRAAPARSAAAVRIYADGACERNPGPCGAGIAWYEGKRLVRERSEYLGKGTNNIGELTAILRALESRPEGDETPVDILTDSQYSIDVVCGLKRAKANAELVATVQAALEARPAVNLVKVAGHSGEPGNERADKLAVQATHAMATWDSEGAT